MGTIGELREHQGEVIFEWEIKDFSKLSDKVNTRYDSTKFYFCDAAWQLWIFPNGQEEKSSVGWIGLYIARLSNGYPVSLNYSLKLKTLYRDADSCSNFKDVIDKKDFGWGASKLIKRSELMSRITHSDTLTIICTLTNNEENNLHGSLFSRHQEICDNLTEIWKEAKRSDILLKVDNHSIPAHRLILEARSPVFAAMFRHDTKENQTGEICIDDIQEIGMKAILEYMYSVDFERVTTKNALPIYAAAEKYDVKNVKEICYDFIIRNISVDWVCDIIKFADLYQEEEISRRSRAFFKENAKAVLETSNWETFSRENQGISVELLATLVKDML